MRLVADIGGTNARLALCENGAIVPLSVRNFINDEWLHFYDIVAAFLGEHARTLDDMIIAVAGPVYGDRAMLTNRNWTIEASELARQFGCLKVVLMNDLTALGYAVPTLRPDQLKLIHFGVSRPTDTPQSLVVGIGTGFNVSPVLGANGVVHCFAVEAGHMSMPKSVSDAVESAGCAPALFPTIESLFSGRGFTLFCQQVSGDGALDGVTAVKSYRETSNPEVSVTVDCYAALVGQLLRELSLAYLPSAGVYLAGSVARAVASISPTCCTDVFGMPCALLGEQSPDIFTIEDDFAALNGCAAFGQGA